MLFRSQALPQPDFRWIEDQDWSTVWKDNFRPIPVGRRLVIRPPWAQAEPTGRLPIVLDPGMAFGTGAHPSTRLCLLALEDRLHAGDTLIDLGCGSGILSIAAVRLGAARCLGLDIDSKAIENACGNLLLNQVEDKIELCVGSLADLLPPTRPEPFAASVVVANILAKVLIALLGNGLARVVEPGGTLILSGILEDQLEALMTARRGTGLDEVETLAEGEWRALVLKNNRRSHG